MMSLVLTLRMTMVAIETLNVTKIRNDFNVIVEFRSANYIFFHLPVIHLTLSYNKKTIFIYILARYYIAYLIHSIISFLVYCIPLKPMYMFALLSV